MAFDDFKTIGAATQNRGVAGFQTKATGIGGDVWTAFIDDADDTDGHGDAADFHAIGSRPFVENSANRVFQFRDLLKPLGHGLDARCD